MTYKSQIEAIWVKLSTEGSIRRPTTSRISFDNIVAAFQQAEKCPISKSSTDDEDNFRAEWNIWTYYFGEACPFPGIDPLTGQTTTMTTTTFNSSSSTSSKGSREDARAMRRKLEELWTGRWNRKRYKPQLGWNEATGEPNMAVRAYAENSYPALSGEHHSFLKGVERQMPEFTLQYERFPHLGYTLIWPEFASPTDLKNQGAWRRFGQFREFLEEWASIPVHAINIDVALKEYLKRPAEERPGLPLPIGFAYKAPVKAGNKKQSTESRLNHISQGEYRKKAHRRRDGSWTPKVDMRTRYVDRGVGEDERHTRFRRSRSQSPRRRFLERDCDSRGVRCERGLRQEGHRENCHRVRQRSKDTWE